ncbi:MAG: tetratricopeptide repeat protein [Chloroflexi bacterium]|jgi:tetratricopeptide (TPR) repeat protein|nr:tetratricopeptide repeat protein [Chloroflexota bacterium]MBT7079948.1 tetratricopeptide repeat protein [Chloroflexota bacterium]MBT7290240.1 tetratricopeptide repeat protein [Chloroflexota bacterium]
MAIELEPNNAWHYRERATIYLENGDLIKAIADCNIAIDLDPNKDRGYFTRGKAYLAKGETANAISDLEKAIEVSNDPALINQAQQLLNEI